MKSAAIRDSRFAIIFLALILVVASCASAPRRDRVKVKPVPGAALVRMARTQIGKPYVTGGRSSGTGFDCSGLVWWTYRQFNSEMPRRCIDQFREGVAVSRWDLKPGDLVFFDTGERFRPGHVGIYVGEGRFIHAPTMGQVVREDELQNNYWRHAYMGARRIE